MITITVPKREVFDTENQIFYRVDHETTIQLEHSLISLQKWESKWHVPFLYDKTQKTFEQTIDYIRCMCVTPNVKEDVFYCIPPSEMQRISEYIHDPMTATWFRDDKKNQDPLNKPKKEIVTAEIIYYWMITLNIPSEYKKWHLNQLLTLIRVINVKNTPQKKRPRREILEEYKAINEENKKKFNTKG